MLQSVLILYDMKETARAEDRVLTYLEERPDGQYARTMLSLIVRDNLVKQNFERVTELAPYMDGLPPAKEDAEVALQL